MEDGADCGIGSSVSWLQAKILGFHRMKATASTGLEQLIFALSPDLVDFGRMPKSASDPGAQLVRQVVLPSSK